MPVAARFDQKGEVNPPVTAPSGFKHCHFFLFSGPLASFYQIATNLGEFLAVKKGRDCDLDVGEGNRLAKKREFLREKRRRRPSRTGVGQLEDPRV